VYRLLIFIVIIFLVFFSGEKIQAQEPKLETFQETAQVFIDQVLSNNVTAAIALQSTSNQQIRVPSDLENTIFENKWILAVVITNERQCVLGVQEDESCIMVNISSEGIEGGIIPIQDKAREVGDSLIETINETFDVQGTFHSSFVHQVDDTNVALETSGVISGRGTVSAVYTIPKEDTQTMYEKFSTILLPKEIRDAGGFFEVAKRLSAEPNSKMTFSIIPQDANTLFQLKLSLIHSGIADSIEDVSPLEFLVINELKRSKYFSTEFYPLNSLLKLVFLSTDPIKVDQVNTKIVPVVIRNGERFPDFTKDGWFFESNSGEKIEATYLFGERFSVNEDELSFKISSFNATEQNNGPTSPPIDTIDDYFQVVLLVGIGIASTGAIVYYLKGFRSKS